MTTTQRLDIVVVGAGMIGLTAGLLLARDGHRVTLLERDPDPVPATAESAWESWHRPGVSQFRQPHLMLPRWHHEMARELPELLDELVAGGARRLNLLHLQPVAATGIWQPGDEVFDTVTARRPVLEAALARLASTASGLTIRRGIRVTGLLADTGAVPQVRGVRTGAGDLSADLVVDAAGRRSPVPAWVGDLTGQLPPERSRSGFVYYSRQFRADGGRLPGGGGPVLTHLPSLSVLTLPGDRDTYCVVLVASSRDRALRALRDERAWRAAVDCSPVAAHWVRRGTPMTGVTPFAGTEDVRPDGPAGDGPPVAGVVAIGDALTTTAPLLGRGVTLGVIAACTLRDVLAVASGDPAELVARFGAEIAGRVAPWVELSSRFAGHRSAEMNADIDGIGYRPADPTWPATTALLHGAGHDPVLARASSRIAGLIQTPAEVLADPAIGPRLGRYFGEPRYPPTDPTRNDLLRAIAVHHTAVPTPLYPTPLYPTPSLHQQ